MVEAIRLARHPDLIAYYVLSCIFLETGLLCSERIMVNVL